MESLFKVGDTVKIKFREGPQEYYRCHYTDGMTKYEGRVAKITNLRPSSSKTPHEFKDDGFNYRIDIDNSQHVRTTAMLEKSRKRKKMYNFKFIT